MAELPSLLDAWQKHCASATLEQFMSASKMQEHLFRSEIVYVNLYATNHRNPTWKSLIYHYGSIPYQHQNVTRLIYPRFDEK